MPISKSLPLPLLFAHSLFFNKRCEQISQVALNKRATWVNRSHRSLQKSDCEQFAQVAQDKRAKEQMRDSLKKLMSKLQIPNPAVPCSMFS